MAPSTRNLPPGWAELVTEGIIQVDPAAAVNPTALALPADRLGTVRPIRIGPGAIIGAHVILHGGTEIADGAEVGHGSILGEPESGYALREVHDGAGATTLIASGASVRAGVIAYAGVKIGPRTTIGHGTLLRTNVVVGVDSQIGHGLTIERDSRIGDGVRCSPLTHLTANMHIGDGAFVGARVATVNDKHLIWRDAENEVPLDPPRIESGARVGTGTVLMAGVVIGAGALVGAGSVVTHSVAPQTVVYGSPAREHHQKEVTL
jgi:acetyltransferase-like isoleucine patch superfamily enzyme